MKKVPTFKQLKSFIVQALDDAKAQNICMLDVRDICDFTDVMVIASGTSTRHVGAIADRVIDGLGKKSIKPVGIEGMDTADWVLLDFGDAVVHIMRPQIREFYALEKLWRVGARTDAIEN
jgi:ribosome-associated protein